MTTAVTVFGCAPEEVALVEQLAPRLGVVATTTSSPLSEANAGLARGTRCVSVNHKTPVTGAMIEGLGRVGVRFVSTRSIGLDHVDLHAAERAGVRVEGIAYSPGSVADYTLMLTLMVLRHAKAAVCGAGRDPTHEPPGRELGDLTVGVVGTGRIGLAVIERLRGFGCRVLTHDLRPADGHAHVPLDDLLRRSDVVTLHVPLMDATHHLLDRRRIALLRPGAVLVNTGRGALVDTAALLAALVAGRLGGAALDVVEDEAEDGAGDKAGDKAGERLRRLDALPNVLVTPHTAYRTDRAVRDMVQNSLRACVSFERRAVACPT
nr:NAD(P)-dependent oxidoreductase [Nocardioides halotolerans]